MNNNSPVESFNERLKIAMRKRNITRTEFANLTGFSSGMISDYINGRVQPKQDKVLLIANVLHVSPSWLLGFENEMTPKPDDSKNIEINADDIFTFKGNKITGKEVIDLINKKINNSSNQE